MPRGNAEQNKVHYKGKENDYIVFVEDKEQFEQWKTDSSVPLAQFMGSYQIFVTDK